MIPDYRPAVRPAPGYPIGMVVLDIDGTLVAEDLSVGERTRATIRAAMDRGVHVSLATGRMASSAVVFAAQLGLTAPIVGHQGAVIREMPRRPQAPMRATPGARGRCGRVLHHAPIPAAAVREAVRWCRAHGLDPHVNDLERVVVWQDDPTFSEYAAYVGKDALLVPDLETAISRPMSKVIAVGEPGLPMALVDEARAHFAGRADVTVSHPRFLEFVAPGVSKGRAVAWLARRAGVPLSRVLTIGDSLNDLEMLADAGHAAAMPSAPAPVREAARYLAPPVREEGVATLIEQLVLAGPGDAALAADRLAAEAARAPVSAAGTPAVAPAPVPGGAR